MTIEVVRHVTVRTPHGGNDEREAKLNPDHDHDHGDDHDPDYDHDDGDDDDEKDKTNHHSNASIFPNLHIFQTNKLSSMWIISAQHVLVL